MLRSFINAVLCFCAPSPEGYLHALIRKRTTKPLQVLKGYFLGRFSFPLNLHLKQLLHSLFKPRSRRSSGGSCGDASEAAASSGQESISQTLPGEKTTSPQWSLSRLAEETVNSSQGYLV